MFIFIANLISLLRKWWKVNTSSSHYEVMESFKEIILESKWINREDEFYDMISTYLIMKKWK